MGGRKHEVQVNEKIIKNVQTNRKKRENRERRQLTILFWVNVWSCSGAKEKGENFFLSLPCLGVLRNLLFKADKMQKLQTVLKIIAISAR